MEHKVQTLKLHGGLSAEHSIMWNNLVSQKKEFERVLDQIRSGSKSEPTRFLFPAVVSTSYADAAKVMCGHAPLGELWIYKDCLFDVDPGASPEDAHLAIRQEFERNARQKSAQSKSNGSNNGRSSISESVRHAVWRRDQGKCTKCGSREKLEFDHIIPVSQGGSNTERNIELLCEKCNRSKGANLS